MADPRDFLRFRHENDPLGALRALLEILADGPPSPGLYRDIVRTFSRSDFVSPRTLQRLERLAEGAEPWHPYRYEREFERLSYSLTEGFRSALVATRESQKETQGLQNQLQELRSRFEVFEHDSRDSRSRDRSTAFASDAIAATASLSLPIAECSIMRFLFVRVYLTQDEERLYDALSDGLWRFLEAFGIVRASDLQVVRGSFFKQWVGRTKDFLSQEEIRERLEKAERALQLQYVEKVQSEVDKNQAEAAAHLLGSVKGVDEAVCQVGSLLVISRRSADGKTQVAVRTLTPREMIYIEKNPVVLHTPTKLLETLSSIPLQE